MPEPEIFRDSGQAPELVAIPAGSFLMGSPDDEPMRWDHESPRHRVEIARPFALGRFAVSFTEFDLFVEHSGYRHRPNDEGWGRGWRPVIDVSWEDARAYCDWLSKGTGRRYRLPSEAEWEYACRAGTTTPFSTGRTLTAAQACFNGGEGYGGQASGLVPDRTVEVGTYPPNPYGLYEMHGNVCEWVEDVWHDSYEGAPDDGGAWSWGHQRKRVNRGGAYSIHPRGARSANRYRADPDMRLHILGLRVARDL